MEQYPISPPERVETEIKVNILDVYEGCNDYLIFDLDNEKTISVKFDYFKLPEGDYRSDGGNLQYIYNEHNERLFILYKDIDSGDGKLAEIDCNKEINHYINNRVCW